MKRSKTLRLVTMVLVMAFLIGCHNQSSSSTTTTKSVVIDDYDFFTLDEVMTTTYYNSKTLDVSLSDKPGTFQAVNGVVQGGQLWILVEQTTENSFSYYFEVFDLQGEREEYFPIEISSYCSRTMNYIYADSESVYLILPSGNEDALFDLYSVNMSSHEMNKSVFRSEHSQKGQDSIDEIVGVRDGFLYVSVTGTNGTACQIYDLTEKKYKAQTDYVEKVWPQGWFWSENKLCVVEDTGTYKESKIIEFSSEGVAEAVYEIPGHWNGFTCQNGNQYMVNEQGIWKRNNEKNLWENFLLFSNTKSEKLADYMNDRFSFSSDDTRIIEWSRYSGQVQLLFVDQDPTEGKKEMVLAGMDISYNDSLKAAVQEFNEASDTYFIKILDYIDLLDENDFVDSEGYIDYVAFCEAVQQKLLKDILDGNAPDMLYRPIDGEYKLNSAYVDIGGYLKDMYPYWMDESEEWKKQIVPCIFAQIEKTGEMKAIPFSFRIKILEKTRSCGIAENAGYGQWLEYMEKQSEYQYFSEDTPEDFLRECLYIDLAAFVDSEQKQVHFEKKEFGELMRLAKQYCPTKTELKNGNIESAAWFVWDWYGHSFLFDNYHSIYGLPSLSKCQGVPTASGAQYCVKYTDSISVTENCKDADVAWEFIKQFVLADMAQESDLREKCLHNTPVRVTALEKTLDLFQNPEAHLDYWNDQGEFDDDGWDGTLHGYTNEELQTYWELLNSVTYTYYPDTEIVDIVVEEASAYFAGQKSLEEVEDLINHRVQIVLNERSA